MKNVEMILGTQVQAINYEQACDHIFTQSAAHRSCYIIAANVHVVMTAYWNASYRQVVNNADLVTPDGMPLVLALRCLGHPQAVRVYGPDLMLACCQRAAQEQVLIYLYGGTDAMLQKLKQNLQTQFSNLQIAGAYAPPFRALTPEEEQQDIARIHQSGATILFVALGCPKQEFWMARQLGQLKVAMIGVGAAFAFHSGEVNQAPRWMMAAGLEWLYRFSVEPQRLWKRYLVNNPAFILLFCIQWLKRLLA